MQSKKSANKNYHFYKIVFGISLGFLAGSFGLTLYANAESTPNNQGGITTIASKVQYVRSINFSGAVMSGIIQNGKSYLSITSPISMGKSQEIKNNNTIYGNHEGNVAGENIVMFGGDKNTVSSNSIILGGSGNTIKGGIALGGEGNSGENAIMFVGTKNKAGSGDFLLGGNDIKSAGGNTVFGDHVTIENGKSSNFIFSDGNFTGKGTDTFFLDVENGVGINTYGTTGVALTISGAMRIEKTEAGKMPTKTWCQTEGAGTVLYFSGCICACNGNFFESLQGVGEISDAEAERCTLACNQGDIELYQKFKITYNLNGGTGNIPEQEYKKGETNLRVTTSIPTKANFTFLRREETIGANTVSYQSGATIDSNTGHILKAVWGGNKYTVTFDADGGTPNNTKQTVTYRDTYPYADFPKVTKTNNCFTGWYYNTTRITNQSKVEVNSSHTLKAHWIFIQGATKYDTNTCKAVQCDTTNNNNPDTCPTGGHCTPVTGYTLSNGTCNPITKQKVESCEDKSTTYPLIASQKVTGGRYEEITSYKKDGNACIEEKRYKFIGCEAGYAGSNNTCTPCGIGTYAPQGSTQCISCSAGYTAPERSTSSDACVTSIVTCSATTYYDGNTQSCKSCEAGSYCPGVQVPRYSPTTTGMIICPSGSYAPAGAKSCTQCPAGTYSTTIGATNNKTCQACGDGKWSTTGANICQNIQAGCYGTSGKTQCPNECKAGTYSVGGTSACSPVIAGCYGDQKKATTSCPKECTAGYYSTGGATACSKVQAGCKGSAKATTSCPEACETGMYSLAGSSSCSPCEPHPLDNGEYTSNGTTAQGCTFKCNAGYQAGTSRNCVGVNVTVIFSGNGGTPANQTKTNTFGNNYQLATNPTLEGKTFAGWWTQKEGGNQVTSSTKVTNFNQHTLYAHWSNCTQQTGANSYNANCSIKDCKADFYKDGNSCVACIDGYSSPAGSTTSSQCTIEVPAGYYLKTKNTTSIEACAKGSYKAKHTVRQGETSSCTSCPTTHPNTENTASTSESQCFKNITVNFKANGSNTTETAKNCNIFKNSTSCSIKTPAITAKDGWNKIGWNTSSTAQSKQYSENEDITVTTDTTYYAITSKKIDVTITKGANVSSVSNTSKSCTMYNKNTSCTITKPTVSCSAGTEDSWWPSDNLFSVGGTKTAKCTIQNCSAGEYKDGTTCKTCPAGSYCSNNTKTDCPAGTVGNGQTGKSTQNTACNVCPAGSYCGGGNNKNYCPAGTFRDSTGGKTPSDCTKCAVGSYTNTEGATSCTVCTNGKTTSTTGKTSCDQNCSQSNVNTWNTPSRTNNSVTNACSVNKCNAGYYLNNGSCSSCPSGMKSNTGSTSISSCRRQINITFNKNSARIINSSDKDSIEIPCFITGNNTTCTISAPTIRAKLGYDVVGWNKSSMGTSSEWDVGTSKTFSQATTYYAITSKTITVNFKTGSHVKSISSDDASCTIYNSNTSCKLLSIPTITCETNYTDAQWSPAITTSTTFSQNTTITASCPTAKTCTITLDLNGGSSIPWSKTNPYSVTCGDSIGTITDPVWYCACQNESNAPYTFDGWYTKKTGGTKITSTDTVNQDVIYYAHWKAKPINGVCGSTHYSCSSGISTNNVNDTVQYRWTCEGSNGGETKNCYENKTCKQATWGQGGGESSCDTYKQQYGTTSTCDLNNIGKISTCTEVSWKITNFTRCECASYDGQRQGVSNCSGNEPEPSNPECNKQWCNNGNLMVWKC